VIKRLFGWVWLVGAVAALIAVQALAQAGLLARVDGILNSARVLVPVGIGLAAVGVVLMVAAMIHGLATDSSERQIPLTLDGRVGSDTTVDPGKVAVRYHGRTSLAGEMVFGYFRGTLLWGRQFYEETRMSELKRAWRTGEWLHVHRYLRATVALSGFLLMLIGGFGTVVLVSDLTAVRLLLLLALAYALVRTAYAFARA
jgi:hypothetical protein